MTERYRLLNEGLGGIKDIILRGSSYNFIKQFETASAEYARARGANIAISQVPRYLIELIAFGSVISLILYLLSVNEQNISLILPLLSVYAVAALKLLPSLQQVYSGFAQVKGNMGAYEALAADLHASRDTYSAIKFRENIKDQKLTFEDEILLKDISFSYEKNTES